MARPAFKAWWTQFIPEPAERSSGYILAAIQLEERDLVQHLENQYSD